MFYVNSKKGNKYGVVDTKDKIEEFYTEKQLRSMNIDILGLYDNSIMVVTPPNMVDSYIRRKLTKDLLGRLPLCYEFELFFYSNPVGELNIQTNYAIKVRRDYKGKYILIDENRRYHYDEDVYSQLDWYVKYRNFKGYRYKEV